MTKRQTNASQQEAMFRRQRPNTLAGYYSGDQPNPNLRAFVEAHCADHEDEADLYDVAAFDARLTVENRRDPINDLHIYWSKKPYKAIQDFVRHYTTPGDLVLDPFCGSGGTALAALMEGCKAIAIDRSPAATFITKNYCTPVDPDGLRAAFAAVQASVQPEIDWLYATRCDRCAGPATTAYTVYSQVFQCQRCLTKVPLFDCVEATNTKNKPISACPHCHARGITEEISTRAAKFGAIPVLVNYLCQNGCKPARAERRHNETDVVKREYFQRFDLGKLDEIEAGTIPHWVPPHRMMNIESNTSSWGEKWRQGTSNFRTVSDLFTKRNLWALAAILDAINQLDSENDALRFALSGALWNGTKMYRHRELGGGPQSGTYYLAQLFREIHGWTLFDQKVSNLIRSAELTRGLTGSIPVCISTQSATNLSAIPASSIDYIFTDPPYADQVQYGELNFVWEAWLGLDTHWHGDEIIVNSVRGKSEAEWAATMRQAMSECFRVLRPGRWLSLCYHDTSAGTWQLVQDIMAEAGFLPDTAESALFIDTGQKSYNQLTADKVTKRDLVINFRKPRPGEAVGVAIRGDIGTATFTEQVHAVIRDFLGANPWATKDRIYDEVVSRMVRAGRMEPHNFDLLLQQVAEPAEQAVPGALRETSERWYLKETALAVEDAAETAREEAAARKIGPFLARRLGKQPDAGVHYSDIFEQYVYAVKDKPRRPLADWLIDYFFQTESGTYRLPVSEEETALKAQARAAGTNRRVRRYVAYLQGGVSIPAHEQQSSATLVDWIRQCKRAGLYEYGKLLFERGGINLDSLTETQLIDAEEDYQTCIRMLARAAAPEATGKRVQVPGAQQETFDL